MREQLLKLVAENKTVAVYFPAAAGNKLQSATGNIREVGDDYLMMTDIYGNAMLVPLTRISYIEVKK